MQKKSHALLLKLLNNIGVIGAIFAGIVDIIFVIIMIFGVKVDISITSIVIFAIVNALIGFMINVLLRYQGQKYAEIENEELCKQYYNKQIKEKKYVSMGKWTAIKTIEDIFFKVATTVFSIFGMIYISIQGSHNPIQLLITLATLVLFTCFGLIAMNSSYTRFYNIQVPYMQLQLSNGNTYYNRSNTSIVSNNDSCDQSVSEQERQITEVINDNN